MVFAVRLAGEYDVKVLVPEWGSKDRTYVISRE